MQLKVNRTPIEAMRRLGDSIASANPEQLGERIARALSNNRKRQSEQGEENARPQQQQDEFSFLGIGKDGEMLIGGDRELEQSEMDLVSRVISDYLFENANADELKAR